ncbi:hypothetical protein FF1_001642 [Malus domestica]
MGLKRTKWVKMLLKTAPFAGEEQSSYRARTVNKSQTRSSEPVRYENRQMPRLEFSNISRGMLQWWGNTPEFAAGKAPETEQEN